MSSCASSPFSPSSRLPPASDVYCTARRMFAGLCSLGYLLFNCRHFAFRLRTEPRTLNPHEGTHPAHCTSSREPKTPCFPEEFRTPVPGHGTYTSYMHFTVPAAPNPKTRVFSRKNRTFAVPASPHPTSKQVHTAPIAPILFDPKTMRFPRQICTSHQNGARWFIAPSKNPWFSRPVCPQKCRTPKKQKPYAPVAPSVIRVWPTADRRSPTVAAGESPCLRPAVVGRPNN